MKYLLYILELIPAIILAAIAFVFCYLIALFVDKDGHLPKWLKWFETVDATCYDVQWVKDHPTWSKYKIAYTWIRRNPAYGFNYFVRARVTNTTKVKFSGKLEIADGAKGVQGWNFIRAENGFFFFEWILRIPYTNSCIRGEYGWVLKPLALGYDSTVLGALQVVLLFRFASFGVENK